MIIALKEKKQVSKVGMHNISTISVSADIGFKIKCWTSVSTPIFPNTIIDKITGCYFLD